MVTTSRTILAPGEAEELLGWAEEAGRLGLFEWHVQTGAVRLSTKCQFLYGIVDFDGRYDTWLKSVFREDVSRLVRTMEAAFESRTREIEADFRIVRSSDGELRWIQSRRLAFYNGDGLPTRVIGVSMDVTELKRAAIQQRVFTETLEDAVRQRTRELEAENEARKKAEESLRQAQKMEAVGQLTGGVAHDFNNLLTVILGGLDVIARQIPNIQPSAASARIVRAKDMAAQGAKRAALLTARLLAFSRQQALSPKPIDVNQLVAETSELLRRTIGESVSLETVLAGGLWLAYVDGNQLENALLNLAVNARDAMPDGGRLTIETNNCHLDEAYVGAITEPVIAGQYVMIGVGDTGVGMDAASQSRAFEPFYTTKDVGKGTGLGLSQVYGFVRQSSGHVRIYSEVGQGTIIKIYLPRYVGTARAQEEVSQHVSTPRAIGKETILVVEDDEALRSYAVEVLAELGYHIVNAPNAIKALELLDQNSDIALLFTDVVMPGGVNGRQLADEARRRRPNLKVLFTTGYTRNAIIHQGRLDLGVHLIGKPFSFDDLGRKVRSVLDGDPA